MDIDDDDILDSDWGGLGTEEDGLLRGMGVLSHDSDSNVGSFKKRTRTATFESFDSQNEEFMKNQLNMSNIVDEDDISMTSDSEHHQFESMLASIPQLLKKKTEFSVRLFATKYINNIISEVVSSPNLRLKMFQYNIHKVALLVTEKMVETAKTITTSKKIEEQAEKERQLIESNVPDLESLVLQHREEPVQLHCESTTSTNLPTIIPGAPAVVDPPKHHQLMLQLHCLGKMNIVEQRSFLSAAIPLFKRSILNILDEGIPLLVEVMEAEFLTLSGTFDEFEKFVFADLKGFNDEGQSFREGLSKILDYSHNVMYSDAQKKALSLVLLRAEKKLKHRLKRVTETSKAYYEQVEGRIHHLARSCSRVRFFDSDIIIPPSVKKKLHQFDMTNVIDFIRGDESLSAQDISMAKDGDAIMIGPQETHHGTPLSNLDGNKVKLESTKKNFNKYISELISARLRYEEAQNLSDSTKKVLQDHLERQINGVNSLLNVLDEGAAVYNSDDDTDEHFRDYNHLVLNDERLKSKQNRQRLPSSVSNGKYLDASRGSKGRSHFHRRNEPLHLREDFVESIARNMVLENQRTVGLWTNNHHKEGIRREHTLGLLNGLDLMNSTNRFTLKAPLPDSLSRPSSPDRWSTAELKTMMQKLGYRDFEFDRPLSPSSKKSHHDKPLVEILQFQGKPSGKFAFNSKMIENYQFSPKRIKSYFKNLPISPEEKKKKMEQNRISDLHLDKETKKSPTKTTSRLKNNESETSLHLEEFILGKNRQSSHGRASGKKCMTNSSTRSLSILHELPDDKLPEKQAQKLGAKSSKDYTVSKSTDNLFHASTLGKSKFNNPSKYANMVQPLEKLIAEPKFTLPQDVLDAFHEPVVWNGEDEVNSVMMQKALSHQMIDLQDDHQLYYQGSLEPIDIGSVLEIRTKITSWFEEIGLVDETDDCSVDKQNDLLTLKIDHSFHNLQTLIEDDRLINNDWESLVEETRFLFAQFTSLSSGLQSALNNSLLNPFVESLQHSKLIRKEAELEILECFIKRSVDASRLQSMGILSIPVDYFGNTLQHVKNEFTVSQRALKLNVVKYARESSSESLNSALDKVQCSTIPFRMGNKDKDTSAKNRSNIESILASKPRTAVEQQIDHSFYTLGQLRRQLRTSLLNLLEIVCANTLFPLVFMMTTECRSLKVGEYLQGLQEAIELHSPFVASLDDLNLQCLTDHEVFSPNLSMPLKRYDIDDYHVAKEQVKIKTVQHAMFQLNGLTETLLLEAKETSSLIYP
jgi:hypothetical protein